MAGVPEDGSLVIGAWPRLHQTVLGLTNAMVGVPLVFENEKNQNSWNACV